MPYLLNTQEDQQAMLEAIGAASIDELFAGIPESMRLSRPLDVPPALSELELAQHLHHLAGQNDHIGRKVCFLGGGSYDHFVPAVVDTLAARGEFYTSYTPYQPEVSQGNLQAMFEYQTMICQLTGHGCVERQPVRRRQRGRRSGADGDERDTRGAAKW
jgi:glycine dehydrogenase subunit 1